jgi:MFS family permease
MPMSTLNPTAAMNASGRMTARSWAMLLVLCGAIFLEGLDVSMMGVALPSIQSDLGMSTSSLQWVVSAYVLGYGGFMLLGGRAADLLGRRRMFLLWLGVFVVFSGLGGIATDSWMIILARLVTGVAAAFMTPAGLSIITTSFPEGPVRNRALLIYSGTGAAGFTLGLVAGGILTEFGWRLVFFVPVLVSLAVLLAAVRLIPAGEQQARTDGFDIAGALTATAAMVVFAYTVVNATETGWLQTAATGVASAVLLGLFLFIERRASQPLVRLGILRSPALVRANLSAGLFAGSFMAFQFLLVLYLQQVRGWSALETGLAMVVAGLDLFLAPTLIPVLVNRFGVNRVILTGLISAALGFALFVRVDPTTTYVTGILPSLILIGIAFAFAYGPLTIAATDGVASEEQGLAGGLLYTSWQFGTAIGLAVVTAVLVSSSGEGEVAGTSMDHFSTALYVPVAIAILSAIVIALGLRPCNCLDETAPVDPVVDSRPAFAPSGSLGE